MEKADVQCKRLDQVVCETRGLPRTYVKELILAGKVTIDGQARKKPGQKIHPAARITVADGGMQYVGRGGYKLEKALTVFGVSPRGRVCVDVGASTGGFTDCMLQNGAAVVYAVDAGIGQLVPALRADSRVISMEKTKIQEIGLGRIPLAAFLAADVSFVSLTKVIPYLRQLLSSSAVVVLLIKPQFEAGRGFVHKNGIVRDARVHQRVIAGVYASMAAYGLNPISLTESPVKGQHGNIEYLIYGDTGLPATEASAFYRAADGVVKRAFAKDGALPQKTKPWGAAPNPARF